MWTLRQPRYAAIALVMLVLASGCIAAGTFEWHRYRDKVHDNSVLRKNAHAAPAALDAVTASPTTNVTYRRVTATGRYLPGSTQFLADQTQDGRQGFGVVTPLRTDRGVALVVRGFVAATPQLRPPSDVPPAPTGVVTVRGWLRPGETRSDKFDRMGSAEIAAINVREQSARLGRPAYADYLTLDAGQPGTSGLAAVPLPSLANPTGGAEEWQLASYVAQWYTFALLALIAPFLISRSEVRDARRRFLGVEDDARQFDAASALPEDTDTSPDGAEVAVRAPGTVARPDDLVARRWDTAVRLADRYGRPLGPDASPDLLRNTRPVTADREQVRDSRSAAHRSADDYHGSYNDLLWELALADGQEPSVTPREGEVVDDAAQLELPEPRPIDPDGARRDQ